MNREQLLDICKETVTKHRQSSYGMPESNFGKIAAFWSTYLGVEIKPYDVANLMVLLKVARCLNDPSKEDTWVDVAGYAACGCEVATGCPAPNSDGDHDWATCGVPLKRKCTRCGQSKTVDESEEQT